MLEWLNAFKNAVGDFIDEHEGLFAAWLVVLTIGTSVAIVFIPKVLVITVVVVAIIGVVCLIIYTIMYLYTETRRYVDLHRKR